MLFEHFLRTYIPLREHHLSLEWLEPSALLEGSKAGQAIERREAQQMAVHPTFSILRINYGLSLKVPDLIRRCQALTNHPHLTIFRSAGPFVPPASAAPADALDLAVDDRVFLVEKLLSSRFGIDEGLSAACGMQWPTALTTVCLQFRFPPSPMALMLRPMFR